MKKLLISIVFVLPSFLFSQTIIETGDVSGTWTLAGSPYLIEGDVSIILSDTLVIEPGVVIEFQDYYKFIVEGLLHAIGSVDDSITFTVSDTTGFRNYSHAGWGGIRFDNANENDSSYLCYCKIEYGKGTGGKGGGVNINFSDNVNISNTVIQYCVVLMPHGGGGGLLINYSNIKLENIDLKNNYSYGNGGGLFLNESPGLDAKSIKISNCTARNNGGGLYSSGVYQCFGSLGLSDFTIKDNNAGREGGGFWSESDIELTNSNISNNYALWGGGVFLIDAKTKIINSTIKNNSADIEGGGIYINNSVSDDAYISDCRISKNNSKSGGGIYLQSANPNLENSIIDSNYAVYGGGISIGNSQSKLQGLTINNNYADFGGGIYFSSTEYFTLNMDTSNLCSIYSNAGKIGKDLFSEISGIIIYVDTFSVQTPTDYYAIPSTYYTFNVII